MKRILLGLALVLGVAGAAVAVYAQDGFGGRRAAQNYDGSNIGYDGKLAFVRLRYATGFGGFGRRNREPPWAHDYPTADQHMMKILSELTTVGPHTTGSNIYSLDDPGPDEPSDPLSVRTRAVDDERAGGERASRLPAQGRIHDRRRLPRQRLVEPRSSR